MTTDALALMKAVYANPRPITELYRGDALEKAHRSDVDALTLALMKDALSRPRTIPELYSTATENALQKRAGSGSLAIVRAMGRAGVVGKLVSAARDALSKRVELCAQITNENEWEKVEGGTYTGFTLGADPLEVVLTDVPDPGETRFVRFTKLDRRSRQVWTRVA